MRLICWTASMGSRPPASIVLALAAALCVAAPARALEPLAAPDANPPSAFAAYWLALAWKEHPPKGPQAAKGIVFWSHGVDGNKPQYYSPPNDAVRRLARAGFDVVKIQRNPTHENRWTGAGLEHVADLVRRAEAAKAEGYARVAAAGQSYGGIISIEASARTAAIDTVLAFAPGHGSDATNGSNLRRYDSLTEMLLDALAEMKAGRAAIMVAAGDQLHPNEIRGPRVQNALTRRGIPFISFDERMPIRGHGAGSTRQFDAWFGDCLLRFVEAATPPPGETVCPPVQQTRFFLPDDARPKAPAAALAPEIAGMLGVWRGTPDPSNGQEWMVLITEVGAESARWWLATDSGPLQTLSMNGAWWTAKRDGQAFFARNSGGFAHYVSLAAGGDALDWAVYDSAGKLRWSAKFTRSALE